MTIHNNKNKIEIKLYYIITIIITTQHLTMNSLSQYLSIDMLFEQSKNSSKISLYLKNTNNLIAILTLGMYDKIYHDNKQINRLNEDELQMIISKPKWSIDILQNEDSCEYLHIKKVSNENNTYLEITTDCNSNQNIKLRFNYEEIDIRENIKKIINYLNTSKNILDEDDD